MILAGLFVRRPGAFEFAVILTHRCPATMARHGDTRSPSPVGSTYSSSRRPRREDDRYDRSRRDDGRGYRRSRSPEVCSKRNIHPTRETQIAQCSNCTSFKLQRRYRERDHGRDRDGYRRRDRSVDRRDDDSYRPSRRDRSRDRRRDDDRDFRRRSRDRDYRPRRDTSRDRERRRPDDTADLKHKSRRDDSRDRGVNRRSRSRTQEVCPSIFNHLPRNSFLIHT